MSPFRFFSSLFRLHLTSGIYEVLRSETEQNLGEGRAEPRTVYPLLYEGERNEVKRKRSVPLSFKEIFLLFLAYYS
jgi:hypothetical protein